MIERRKHPRYAMPRGTFMILRDKVEPLLNHKKMSIGEIAMVIYKSKTEMMGQVRNLGLGGIAFEGDCGHMPEEGSFELDLLMTEKGIYIHNIPYSPIFAASKKKRKKSAEEHRSDALEFKKLDAEHKQQLEELLAHCIGTSKELPS